MTDEMRHISGDRGITTVVLMRGEERLSSTEVIPMTMQVGHARLRMDGIGGVATAEEHRYKGYSRRVLEEAMSLMTAGDAVLTTLYGIPNFYPKYGYATLGPEPIIELQTLEERTRFPDGLTVRDGERGDLPALRRLYRNETSTAIGALVRDDDWWIWGMLDEALKPDANQVRVVVRDNMVVGYAWKAATCWWMEHWTRHKPDGFKIGEAFAADAEAADGVLAMCRLWSLDEKREQVAMAIPVTGQVGAAARLQNVNVLERYGDETEFMGRSTGLVALLRAMRPKLESRWRTVIGSMQSFAITVVTGGERATVIGNEQGIEIRTGGDGDIKVAIDPGNVARLVLGGFNPNRVLERLGAPKSVVPVLSLLFPQRFPYIYPADRF
ncbi:hypothetical protein BH24CHL2_BH24CHL2_2340 [soil metagenome]